MVMVRIYVGVVVVGGVYSCAFPTAAASPWSMVMMLSIAIVVTPFHGVPRGIFKVKIFYFLVEPRHFSVRHR